MVNEEQAIQSILKPMAQLPARERSEHHDGCIVSFQVFETTEVCERTGGPTAGGHEIVPVAITSGLELVEG